MPLELVQKRLKEQAREGQKCCEQSTMSISGEGSEDQNADRNVCSKGHAGEVSNGNEESLWELD